MSQLCDNEKLAALMQKLTDNTTNDVGPIDEMLTDYPGDARLHFLRGSVLASAKHLVEAHLSMRKAVEIEPEFAIARFQLGFFELSSGEPQAALATWNPLETLPDDHYIKLFVEGLTCLIKDQFQQTVEKLSAGISANSENPPLNHDMQLIIDKCAELLADVSDTGDQDAVSSTSMLLNRFTGSEQPN